MVKQDKVVSHTNETNKNNYHINSFQITRSPLQFNSAFINNTIHNVSFSAQDIILEYYNPSRNKEILNASVPESTSKKFTKVSRKYTSKDVGNNTVGNKRSDSSQPPSLSVNTYPGCRPPTDCLAPCTLPSVCAPLWGINRCG